MEIAMTQVQLPASLAQRYDALAQQIGESREAVMVQAYMDQVEADDARLEASIAAADRGEVVDAAVADREVDAFLAHLGVIPERLEAIQVQVVQEADALYGRCE